MSLNELILYPTDPFSGFNDRAALIDLCISIGLVGDPFDYYGTLNYQSGINFLNLINFLHSHTIIELGHSDAGLVETGRGDSRFKCRIEFSEFEDQPGVWIGATDKIPLCPNCQFAIDKFVDVINDWFDNQASYQWMCPECHHICKIHELNWQHIAGFCRYCIRIASIHFGEATPTSVLLATLAELTNTPWDYLYYHL